MRAKHKEPTEGEEKEGGAAEKAPADDTGLPVRVLHSAN